MKNLRVLSLVGAIVAILGLSYLAGNAYIKSSSFCMQCHGGKPEGESWKESIHGAFSCTVCHKPTKEYPSLFAVHFKDIKALVGLSNPWPLNKDVRMSQTVIPKETCLKCHGPGLRPTSAPRLGNIMDAKAHRKHINAGLRCTKCHNRVAHLSMQEKDYPFTKKLKEGYQYPNYLVMRIGCWRCHNYQAKFKSPVNGRVPPKNCRTCHFNKRMPDFHAEKEGVPWKKWHGKLARRKLELCGKCHEIGEQQRLGPNTGIRTCYSCHEVPVPHKIEVWRNTHFEYAGKLGEKKAQELCGRCHRRNPSDFCQSCHHRTFDDVNPDKKGRWKMVHFQIVRQEGSDTCLGCHRSRYCATCHTTGEKPKPGSGLLKFDRKYWRPVKPDEPI